MEADQQAQLAFHLAGRRPGLGLEPIEGLHLRPALFARYGDLSQLRYDYPLVLLEAQNPSDCLQSLTYVMDSAIQRAGLAGAPDRIAKHAIRIERQMRRLAAMGNTDLRAAYEQAASKAGKQSDDLFQESVARLRDALPSKGELVDYNQASAGCVFRHVWRSVQARKAKAFRFQVDRLVLLLSDILRADDLKSGEGRSAKTLQAAMGGGHAAPIDFGAMSNLLTKTARASRLPASRRKRVEGLMKTLQTQKFFASDTPKGTKSNGSATYVFEFESCQAAIAAFRERLPKAIELARAFKVADLEIEGEYREEWHDAIFSDYGANGLDPKDSNRFPDYLVILNADSLDAQEADQVAELLSAGLPMKVVCQTNDLLADGGLAGGNLAFGRVSRQLVDTAIGLSDVFVLQSSASHLYPFRDRIVRGLGAKGAALFSVYSGASGKTGGLPCYLVAAAAIESRAFPGLVYDPSAGPDWASRFHIEDNPQPDADWPQSAFEYENQDLEVARESLAFTLLDFVAMDERFAKHFARVPRGNWSPIMAPASECLNAEMQSLPEQVPYLWLVDGASRLHRVIVDEPMMREARRCRNIWRSRQELGGIHNSHARKLLEQERGAMEARLQEALLKQAPSPAPVAEALAVPAAAEATAPQPAEIEAPPPSDDPYIETPRCTSCNECTNLSSLMFAYNENKQAYIKDPNAGTYKQLVEAAEGCQVGIIHPGKPRNPIEPGLTELLERAKPFM